MAAKRNPVKQTKQHGAVVTTVMGFDLRRSAKGAVFVCMPNNPNPFPFGSDAQFLGDLAEELERLRRAGRRKQKKN
jgi:hypothetical protein